MKVYPVRACRALLVAILLLIQIGTGGCEKPKNPLAHSCKDETIKVNASKDPLDHKDIYLCDQKTLTWTKTGNVASFEIVFQDPAFGAATKFGTGAGETTTTPLYQAPTDLTVYKYTITVVGTDGVPHGPFDPHVVGGGGLAQ